ncbi:MAG TPA: ABC transporter permease subunit [Desulfitobacterium sp.]|nr:ABC transporter permease subunit [Desulfitobacterium sp.]
MAYEWLLTWVYPIVSKNPAVTEIAESIPSAVKTVFGVSDQAPVDTFEAFISAQFFARIWTLLLALYGVNTATSLLAGSIEDGTLAIPLATPISRSALLATQAGVLTSANGVLMGATLLGLFSGTARFKIKIEHWRYCRMSLLGFAFFSVISMYSFLFSAWFPEKERALAYAAGLTLAFYGLDIIGGLSEKLSWVRKLSLFQCFQPQEVLEDRIDPGRQILGLTGGAIILWLLAQRILEEKDLVL